MVEQSEHNEGPKERVIDSKVVSEMPVKNGKPRRALHVLVVAAAVGAVGYGLVDIAYRTGYAEKFSKQYVMTVTEYGIQKGYAGEMWTKFPKEEQKRLAQKTIVELPVQESWEVVKPALEAKVKYEWENFKKGLAKTLGMDTGNKLPESAQETYQSLKKYFGDE
jgi:hypothetical protein